jgi:hypothetical protein
MHDMHRKGRRGKTGAWGDANGSRKRPECLARGERNGSRKHPERLKRGEASKRSKMTASDVREIRALYWDYGLRQRDLGKIYGVGKTTIAHMLNGDTWRSVAG